MRKLARDFVGFDGEKMVENCVDLGVLANTLVPIKQRWSLERLVLDFVSICMCIFLFQSSITVFNRFKMLV